MGYHATERTAVLQSEMNSAGTPQPVDHMILQNQPSIDLGNIALQSSSQQAPVLDSSTDTSSSLDQLACHGLFGVRIQKVRLC